jgi:hypothetical protein
MKLIGDAVSLPARGGGTEIGRVATETVTSKCHARVLETGLRGRYFVPVTKGVRKVAGSAIFLLVLVLIRQSGNQSEHGFFTVELLVQTTAVSC